MNRFLIPLALVLLAGGTTLAQDSTATLIVTIHGFKNTDGQVRVYLFDNEYGFPSKPAKARDVRKEQLADTVHVVTYPALPYGTYAVAAHHDKNGDDKMNSNWMHIPKEPTGASHNARGTFGPPSFKKAKFDVAADTVRIDFNVK